MSRKPRPRRYRGSVVDGAVKDGLLSRDVPCEACGADPVYKTTKGRTRSSIQLHHWSYLREHWLDVIPLCRPCHVKVHCGKIAEPRTGRVYLSRRQKREAS